MTTRFYLDDVIAECARAVDVLGREKDVQVDVTAQEDVEVNADEDLIRRMLINLLENAVKHAPPGTRVHVEMTRGSGEVRVAVRDLGPGVPDSDRDRIFQRFVRLEPGAAPGAGLGLPIARWIAEAHGGALVLAESSARRQPVRDARCRSARSRILKVSSPASFRCSARAFAMRSRPASPRP